MYPFSDWRDHRSHGLDQYTDEVCSRAESIMNSLIGALIKLGMSADESLKVQEFEKAVKAFNELNDEDGSIIETDEREELFPIFEEIAKTVGIDTGKYGGGEGIASEWREW